MIGAHIAHDCIIGNSSTFANNTTLAGHVAIQDFVTLGGFTGVHQFCRIGSYSFSAISSVIVKDVPPYILVSGNTAKPSGLNREGLKRNGFEITLKQATFPLEIFLLMGFDYINNPKVGLKKHQERMKFEQNMNSQNAQELKQKIYQKFAEIGIGRRAIIYAKKEK